jgi:hypothetical protein
LREIAIVLEEVEIFGLRLEVLHLLGQILDFVLDDFVLMLVALPLVGLGPVGCP